MTKTEPIDGALESTAPLLAVEATYTDPITGALYIHEDLELARSDWEIERHISPLKATKSLGDVESFVAFVQRFSADPPPLLTWSEQGLRGVLDFGTQDDPGRGQFVATHPFLLSTQWQAWTQLANGETRWSQEQAVKYLDRLAEDIIEPDAATVLTIIRTLRASVKLSADSELREDGSALVSFTKNSTVASKVPIPSEIVISIPVLKGHTAVKDDKLVPVTYRLPVKVRPSVDDSTSTLSFRFFMPTAERVLEDVYSDRVAAAKALLGDTYTLLRATAS